MRTQFIWRAALLFTAAPSSWNQPAGLVAGARAPAFSLPDQNGRLQTLQTLRGPKGLMLVFVRSADWCPYCKGQLVELEQHRETLARTGYGLAAISYDAPEVLADFARRRAIRYPLLSDAGSRVIRAYGVLNESVAPNSRSYGIPNPVTFVLDRDGVVRSRFQEEDYRVRYTLGGLLLREFGAAPAGPVGQAQAKRIALRLAASSAEARPGQRLTLMIEMDLRPGLHVYAPGATGYRPAAWTMEPSPAYAVHPVEMPPPRTLHLKAINETVPVFEGRVRLLRDVTIHSKTPSGEIALRGSFEYQACDERICYPPETVPLNWSLLVAPHIR